MAFAQYEISDMLQVVVDEHLRSWMSVLRLDADCILIILGFALLSRAKPLHRSNPAVLPEDFQTLMASRSISVAVLREPWSHDLGLCTMGRWGFRGAQFENKLSASVSCHVNTQAKEKIAWMVARGCQCKGLSGFRMPALKYHGF